jgi:CO dehydrogenase nickel-insertion accessory protein CooC1
VYPPDSGGTHTASTAQSFDSMLVVVAPSLQSVVTATRIHAVADKIGIRNVLCGGNNALRAADASEEFGPLVAFARS